MSNLFKAPTQSETAQQLADSLPNGRAWASKNIDDSNARKLINSLAIAYNRVQQQIQLLSDEFDILQSIELLPDWEESVGLPGECLGEADTLEQRREQVIQRLRKTPIVTRADYEDFLTRLFPGLGIEVISGYDYYNFEYTFETPFWGDINEKFVLVVKVFVAGDNFEYDFEMPFVGGPDTTQLECILRKITPSNVVIIIEYTG